LLLSGQLRFDPTLSDRAVTDWRGHITVGSEPMTGCLVGLAETLVHEQFHRTQPAYAKTLSFWGGIITQTPVWRRLEMPAYRAAYAFLIAMEQYAVESERSDWIREAQQERFAVLHAFQALYGIPLFPEISR
jgi:hypothetical protein